MIQSKIIDIVSDGNVWQSNNGPMHPWLVTFEDGTVGSANSKSNPPPYQVGDVMFYNVNGYSRNGTAKLQIKQTDQPVQRQAQQPRQQAGRPAPAQTQASAPAARGNPPAQDTKAFGQRVGNSLTNAVHAISEHNKLVHVDAQVIPGTAGWAQSVWSIASQIMRVGDFLEAGKLARKPGQENEPEEQRPEEQQQEAAAAPAQQPTRPAARPAAPANQPTRPAATRPQPGPDGAAFADDIMEQDVPF